MDEANFPWAEFYRRAVSHEIRIEGWSDRVAACPGGLAFQYSRLKTSDWVALYDLAKTGHLRVVKWSDSEFLDGFTCRGSILNLPFQRRKALTRIPSNMVKSPWYWIGGVQRSSKSKTRSLATSGLLASAKWVNQPVKRGRLPPLVTNRPRILTLRMR